MTLYFSNATITIRRNRRIGSADRYSMSATFTAYPATIEPILPERQQYYPGAPGHNFTGFVDVNTPVKENDEIVNVSDGKKYTVRGINIWQGAGLLDHKELTLVAKDA